MRNINSHSAYRVFRLCHAAMRESGERLSGWNLAGTLKRYSERGAAYVETLRSIMRCNRLTAVDGATLADGPVWHVYPAARCAFPVTRYLRARDLRECPDPTGKRRGLWWRAHVQGARPP